MTNGAQMLQTLRDHRPLLLACEAIGWLHMAGKAHPYFLRHHGRAGVDYDDRAWLDSVSPPFPWEEKLSWLLDQHTPWHARLSSHWPGTLTDFIRKHRDSDPGILGLLQAAHGMASGIEKNVPTASSGYLKQDETHMWLSSPFGHPVRNLLHHPPPLLQSRGWPELLERIDKLLDELARLGSSPPSDPEPWWEWREGAIGPQGWLRQAFLSTLAETRLPNNDVTLWDQSYVAAALFKSALAGAILEDGFPWDWKDIARVLNISIEKKGGGEKDLENLDKQGQTAITTYLKTHTRWRVLTVGFGTRHYEARAVKIGDWVGAQRDIEHFFEQVRKLIEVDLALGSLVYRDDETLAFTFPGEREDGKGSLDDDSVKLLKDAIAKEVDGLANEANFDTPPLCALSASTRSFVPMVKELRKARDDLAVLVHRRWTVPNQTPSPSSGGRHVCPVCRVRFNEPPKDANTDNARKSYPCSICRERRRGRLDAWLAGGGDTIWISEVADDNDRVALLTLSFDLEPWLEGEHVDSLRAQSIAEWRRFNPVVQGASNPIDARAPLESLRKYVQKKLAAYEKRDAVLSSLQEGYRYENDWPSFFSKIVEDRADAPTWDKLNDNEWAQWLTHQLFRKLPSPGRVYRFWRTCEAFFDELLVRFREIASEHQNRWRTRRLLLEPTVNSSSGAWRDRETYLGHWRGAPFEVVYLADQQAFITICNLARCFEPQEGSVALEQESQQAPIRVKGDDLQEVDLQVKLVSTPDKVGTYAPVIQLDRSPQRFRVLVPLDRATACIETAMARWREEFARVWDRMPLRIGVVAFPRLTPFQAVIEAARNLEEALSREDRETWRVVECRSRESVTALSLEHGSGEELVLVPARLPDGREDVFYPYVKVEDRQLRWPRDFQHPHGHIYRHMADLRPGDGVVVRPSRIAAVFLHTTARRFEETDIRPLGDFERMRQVWALLVQHVPSLTALRGAWSEIEERSRAWRDPDGRWLPGAQEEWLDLVRAILRERLRISGAALETLVEAGRRGVLEWALEWHLTWLKEDLEGAGT